MRRTSPWVWVAFAAVQIAALGLCAWVMERELEPAAEAVLDDPAPTAVLPTPPQREPAAPSVSTRPGPLFGPPPERRSDGVPEYIAVPADATTQILRGKAGERYVTFGFYPDGNIRFVDADGSCYSGKAESARSRMREEGGTRAFTVQLGVAAGGQLQATFTGGDHDGETIVLQSLPGGHAA